MVIRQSYPAFWPQWLRRNVAFPCLLDHSLLLESLCQRKEYILPKIFSPKKPTNLHSAHLLNWRTARYGCVGSCVGSLKRCRFCRQKACFLKMPRVFFVKRDVWQRAMRRVAESNATRGCEQCDTWLWKRQAEEWDAWHLNDTIAKNRKIKTFRCCDFSHARTYSFDHKLLKIQRKNPDRLT